LQIDAFARQHYLNTTTLIETHWQDLLQVVLSIKAGKISSALFPQMGNDSASIAPSFRELGRVVRTVFLLQYLKAPAPQLRALAECAARFVNKYLFAPFPLERGQLQGGVLLRRRDTRIADFHASIYGLICRTRKRLFLLGFTSIRKLRKFRTTAPTAWLGGFFLIDTNVELRYPCLEHSMHGQIVHRTPVMGLFNETPNEKGENR
jgi:hypothetical protein